MAPNMNGLSTPRLKLSVGCLLALPLAATLFLACGENGADDPSSRGGGGAGVEGTTEGGAAASAGSDGSGTTPGGARSEPEGGAPGGRGGATGGEGFGGAGQYEGPSVGRARTFAALAYSAITAANITEIAGELGVSAAAVSTITGFDTSYTTYGIDSLAPHDQRTILAQQHVTSLVGDIDPRACDTDLTDVVGGLTGDITLTPGVTCMNSFSADVLIDGNVYLDAGGDPNAFFIIRGNMTLTVADGAQVVLKNGAQACSVFWRISNEVTIGKTVKFFGTVVSGTAITMKSGSALNGRALAQTAGVHLDANSIEIPTECTHVQ
jgi:hypothetical protein